MTYEETIDYLYNRLPMFSRVGASAFKKDLTNTIAICEAIGNPHHKLKCIHIAGTNGKGSTSHMLAAILQAAGYKTGLYTSPHLKDFRERIRVDGMMISTDFVARFVEQVTPLIDKIEPSFFEITVAMAFQYFVETGVEVAVIETGLGGRLDSTNVITPLLSVITNIGMDHMNMLGDTIALIAMEKAGIIKPGIPVVIGETNEKTSGLFIDVAKQNEAAISFADQHQYVTNWGHEHHKLSAEVESKHHTDHTHYLLDLPGIYQVKNLLTVLESVHQLRQIGYNINETDTQMGLSQVKTLTGLYGRWDIKQEHPLVVFDVAHNEDGIREIAAQLEITDYHELHIVIGMVKDKEIDKVLELLPKTAKYYFTKAQIPRALNEDLLLEKAKAAGLHGTSFPEVNMAVKEALLHARKTDLILICGSVFIVGEVEI
ncbi:MAG: bifunctional folylpolyglutamate synthase/dihydrofolate synthase [Chitinophagaceae bacterium]|nr:MAG: bifunctional folylpolyglutamate synthase/dihydrofolate synthase [Chitinophagaceae bacterium]